MEFLLHASQETLSLFGRFYSALGVLTVGALLGFVVSPAGKITLGSPAPEYGRWTWVAMLYSTGMGSGLLIRAVQEPLSYYQNPPHGIALPQEALKWTFFHWGFTAWAFYALFGLFYALNETSKKPQQPSVFERLIVVFSTVLGLISAVVLGATQWSLSAESWLNKWGLTVSPSMTVVLLVAIATLSAGTGLKKGIRWLSVVNIYFALFLMGSVLVLGNSLSAFELFCRSLFLYVRDFVPMSLGLGQQAVSEAFKIEWTYFYWAYWLAWAPFTGLFLAKISAGRSLREFVFFTLIVPSLASFVWFTSFAQTAFDLLPVTGAKIFESIYTSLFEFFAQLPWAFTLQSVALLNILTFLITSIDSAFYVLSKIPLTKPSESKQQTQLYFFSATVLFCSLALVLVNNHQLLNTVSYLLILCSLPVSGLAALTLSRLLRFHRNSLKK